METATILRPSDGCAGWVALHIRHGQLVDELARRGHAHRSDLDASLAAGIAAQTAFIDTVEEQRALLASQPSNCYLPGDRQD